MSGLTVPCLYVCLMFSQVSAEAPRGTELLSTIFVMDFPRLPQSAADAFIERIRPRAALLLMSAGSRMVPLPPFTSDHAELRRHLAGLPPLGEKTLYDTVYAAVATLEAARRPGQQAVVIVTDGIDHSSRHRPEDIVAAARAAHVVLYVLGIGPETETLHSFAEQTGGTFQRVASEDRLVQACEELSAQLRRHEGTAPNTDIANVRDSVAVRPAPGADGQTRGRLVPHLQPYRYLALLTLLAGLLVLPSILRRNVTRQSQSSGR